MRRDAYATQARSYLETLCAVKPNRRTGSPGNREATDFFAEAARGYGYEIDATPFPCLDYVCDAASLTHGEMAFPVHASPYSLGCDVTAELIVASTVEELERARCEGRVLLMRGALCAEQLMPRNFVFYNPAHHQRIIALLEERGPAGIVTATARQPDQVGALYPFPLFVDGDFDIPSAYCRDTEGETLAALEGEAFRLRIDARRVPSSAKNVIARANPRASGKVVLTAHIDAYEGSPGASDNASGTVVLLLVAEMLSGYRGEMGVEIAVLNGEDHYSAGGQMDYVRRYGPALPDVRLAVNVDDVGYLRGRTSYSTYACPADLESTVEDALGPFDGLIRGEPWYSGDHMIFVQSGVPSLALTSENMPELMRTVTHTASDTPDLIDCHKLVEIAAALSALVRAL